MRVRTDNGGTVTVSDRCKRVLARIKRGWGSEAITLRVSDDRKYVNVLVAYTGYSTHYRMRILKGR